MALVTLEDAKQYLRVDTNDEDAMIGTLLETASVLCSEVARMRPDQWAEVNGEETSAGFYTEEDRLRIKELMRIAILYTIGYLFEHREDADHHSLMLTLRSLLSSLREEVI